MKLAAATSAAPALADAYREQTDDDHKREWGQFFTTGTIAAFMSSLFRPPIRREVRVLDAGAGTGVLGVAAAEALIRTHDVSAFPSFKEFKKYADEIAWETEVWIADVPAHLLHFNGDRFMGPRT